MTISPVGATGFVKQTVLAEPLLMTPASQCSPPKRLASTARPMLLQLANVCRLAMTIFFNSPSRKRGNERTTFTPNAFVILSMSLPLRSLPEASKERMALATSGSTGPPGFRKAAIAPMSSTGLSHHPLAGAASSTTEAKHTSGEVTKGREGAKGGPHQMIHNRRSIDAHTPPALHLGYMALLPNSQWATLSQTSHACGCPEGQLDVCTNKAPL